jgi:ankyrin repeat protein
MNKIICRLCHNFDIPIDFKTRCKHHFHQKCMDGWFELRRNSCPNCSTKISKSAIVETRILEENYENYETLSNADKKELFVYSVSQNNMKNFLIMAEYEHSSMIAEYTKFEVEEMFYDACKNENVEIIDTLIKLGFKFVESYYGKCILHICKVGHLEILEKLIQLLKYNCKLMDACCNASIGGHTDVVEMLIHMGSNVNIRNDDEVKTPLHFACENGHLTTTTKLIQLGANVNCKDKKRLTPLIYACKNGHVACFAKLIGSGANIDLKFNTFSELFNQICAFGHVEILNKIIEMGAIIHFEGGNDWYPLREACVNGHVDMVVRLVDLGADVNCRGNYDRTPLLISCENGHLEVVKELIQLGANVFLCDENEDTPLHMASANGNVEICEILIRSGINVNVSNRSGNSPLHEACLYGRTKVVQLLLDFGAVESYDVIFKAPAYYAMKNGHKEILKIFYPEKYK